MCLINIFNQLSILPILKYKTGPGYRFKMLYGKKLFYLSTIDMSDCSAQSLQVKAMSEAFSKQVEFELVAFSSQSERIGFNATLFSPLHKRKKYSRSIQVLHYILNYGRKNVNIFTRDFYVALILAFMGRNVVWECHQEPLSLVKLLIKTAGKFNLNLKILSISEAMMNSPSLFYPSSKKYFFHDCADLTNPVGTIISHSDLKMFRRKKYSVNAVYTGALHKGDDISSMEPLFKKFTDWNFLIFGGKNHEEVQSYQMLYDDFPNVTFMGRRDKQYILAIQRHADVLLYPLTTSNKLYKYTSPLKLFEYMASRKPIIASIIGSISEVLTERNAFCYSTKEGVVDAATSFLSAPDELIEEMVEYNMHMIRETYNWNNRAKFIIENCF